MKKLLTICAFILASLSVFAQADPIVIKIEKGQVPVIALPDLRGAGEAAPLMGEFNKALYDQVSASGVLKVAAKSMYPLSVPQQPSDFKPPGSTVRGPWLTDWLNPPTSANYLATGYTAVQSGRLVLFGWLYDVAQRDLTNAQVFGKIYFGDLNADGARKVAQEFAADILARFGGKTLGGTKVYFISDRSGAKELWQMDYDGQNQTQLTRFGEIVLTPSVAADNSKVAYTRLGKGGPSIGMLVPESNRRLPFVNPQASVNTTPEFTPDGKQVLFASSLTGGYANIYISNADGSGLRRITSTRAVEVEPRVNPKNGREVVFTSGRGGQPQLYKMSIEGTDVERLTTGEGEAVNPSWHPEGQLIAFAWTRGFAPGNYNIFVMDANKKNVLQLTHGAGRNQNPVWAPDGAHIVFASNRGGSTQIWTMLADGTQVRQLTFRGNNQMPVWSR